MNYDDDDDDADTDTGLADDTMTSSSFQPISATQPQPRHNKMASEAAKDDDDDDILLT